MLGKESRAKSKKVTPVKLVQTGSGLPDEANETIAFDTFSISTFDALQYTSLVDYYERGVVPKLNQLDYREKDLKIYTDKATYWYDADRETIMEASNGTEKALGCGKIVVKGTLKKAGKTGKTSIEISVDLTPDYQKDYEIIPYAPNPSDNTRQIADFMAQYTTRPFRYLDNIVGVEINFNKVFYKPEPLRDVNTILAELTHLEQELNLLEQTLF